MNEELPRKLCIRWTYKGMKMAVCEPKKKEPEYYTGKTKDCVKWLKESGYRIRGANEWVKDD